MNKIYPILISIAFCILCLSLPNAFVSDDIPGISKNVLIGTWKNITASSGHLLYLNGIISNSIFIIAGNESPIPYRLLNIIIHGITMILAWKLIKKIWNKDIAWIAVSLFAIHPMILESVIWISGLQYPLYTTLLLGSLLCYTNISASKKWWIGTLLCYILALLTSEKAFIFPLIIITYDLLIVQKDKRPWKQWLLFIGITIIPILFLMSQTTTRLTQINTTPSGEQFYNPLIQIPTAIGWYLRYFFYPNALTLYHSEENFVTMPNLIINSALTISYIWLTIIAWKKNKKTAFFLTLGIIALLPTLTPLKVAWIIAERYAYSTILSWSILIGYGVWWASSRLKKPMLAPIIIALIVGTYSIRSLNRVADWKNQDTLWIATSKTSPSDPKTHNNMGDVYARNGDLINALKEFSKAIELYPAYADAYHNAGNTLEQMKKPNEAITYYEKAIAINPTLWQSYTQLANIYYQQKDFQKTKEYLEKANAILPNVPAITDALKKINKELEGK